MEKQEKNKKIVECLKKYMSSYSEREITYILSSTEMDFYSKNAPDVLRQIYDEAGILKDEDNMFYGFVSLLEDKFNIDSNIIEVGGGVIPTIARKIRLKQDKGSITVYDPRLYKDDSSDKKFMLKKSKFDYDTDISKADLIIGFMPCLATELLIRRAAEAKKDFLVGLCEGGHYDFDDYYDETLWQESIIKLAKSEVAKNDLGELIITDLKSYGDPYPVIYNKRKNLK